MNDELDFLKWLIEKPKQMTKAYQLPEWATYHIKERIEEMEKDAEDKVSEQK